MIDRRQLMLIPALIFLLFGSTILGIGVYKEYKDYSVSNNDNKIHTILVDTRKHTEEVVRKVEDHESNGNVFTLKSALEVQKKYFELELEGDDGEELIKVWVGNKVRPLKLVGHKVTIGKY